MIERRIDVHWNQSELLRSYQSNTSTNLYPPHVVQKPIEMYVFINLLCPASWSLEPYIKKLLIEYGEYITIRPIINSHLHHISTESISPRSMNDPWSVLPEKSTIVCDNDFGNTFPKISPWLPSFAIKAAELQGKNAGRHFLRKVQEQFFFQKENIADEDILIACAEDVALDIDEFKKDLYSNHSKKAYQCDLQISKEMGVEHTPTVVFFNKYTDEQGIRLSGLYSYDIYVHILSKVLQTQPTPIAKPNIEEFLSYYKIVANKEIAIVFDWSLSQTATEMKKLQLKQKVRNHALAHGSYWEYIGEENS